MNSREERVNQDLIKIDRLSRNTGNKIRVVSKLGNPINKIIIELNYLTVPSDKFPQERQTVSSIVIDLLERYPLQEPKVSFQTRIFHPNVYKSGLICLGTKWIPTEGLDLLLKRIIQIITFNPLILNEQSPANREALSWYQQKIKIQPTLFPTEKVIFTELSEQKKGLAWKDISQEKIQGVYGQNELIILVCPHCQTKNRLPKGKHGVATCGKCRQEFVF